MFFWEHKKRLQIYDLQPSCGERDWQVHPLAAASLLTRKKADKNLQINLSFLSAFFLRRERDSNPRYLAVQRFSRPPQSTTLPSLQTSSSRVLVFKSDAKVRLFFESASFWSTFFHLTVFFIWKQLLTLFNESSNFHIYIIFIFVLRKYDWTFKHERRYYY